MKKLLFSVVMLATVAVSCNNNEELSENLTKEPMTIGISTSNLDLSYSPLAVSRASGGDDLLAVQVYEEGQPVAYGLVEDWSDLSFEGYSNTTYTVVATKIVDAKTVIYKDGNTYGRPFNSEVTQGLVLSSSVDLNQLASSTAKLEDDDNEYSTPNIDRYYGTATKSVTASSANITTYMKRMSFGVKYEGSTTITLAIAGAPSVVMSNDDTQLFSLNNFDQAYSAAESISAYSEIIATQLGITPTSYDIEYKRNQQVTISTNDDSFKFIFETAFEDVTEYRVLTFEDASYTDYPTTETYWTSLVDSPQYYGSLLYSTTSQYSWCDTDKTSLSGVVNQGYAWSYPYNIEYMLWNGGIAISNYYNEVGDEGNEIDYYSQLSVSNGYAGAAGYNGSANFAIVSDAGGDYNPVYLSFSDATARTIDHLYISSTSYLEWVALYGNDNSSKLDSGNYYYITATGYDAEGLETNSTTYELAKNGVMVSGWNKWSLASLGKVVRVKFSISSDVANAWGITLPTYFAIDDVAVIF